MVIKQMIDFTGISFNIPIQLDVSKIDHLNYSFELNLPNYNLSVSTEPTEYFLNEIVYPTKGCGDNVGKVDWGGEYATSRKLKGVGGSSNDPNRDTNVKNGGWQRVYGTIFVQDRPLVDSDGETMLQMNLKQITFIL